MILYDYQLAAVEKMRNGCILNGGVGSGKSRTSLYYYYKENGGSEKGDILLKMKKPKDLYIITTAKKRDSLEWEYELNWFDLSTDPSNNKYNNRVIVDSWNNIKKYKTVKDSFFIFDEDRVTGSGAWVNAFLEIAKNNHWVILSATPGDTWIDYMPVFIANGYYKNKTDFKRQHVVYSSFTKFPKIDRYLNTVKLNRQRREILVDMNFKRKAKLHHEDIYAEFDRNLYKETTKKRWNPYKNAPITNASELCYVWRRIVNSDESRQREVLELYEKHPKVIIFYNFDYELEILKNLGYLYNGKKPIIAEWNGHLHQDIPKSDEWVYLVQYTSGAEGWNCIETDTIIFFSQNYSYKTLYQSCGRIDRLNTPYEDLYYYHLKTRSGIDLAISRALKDKKKFNERAYVNWSV